jgi:predicted AlkP superfamily pyrophosphatase or phosphodiesterase
MYNAHHDREVSIIVSTHHSGHLLMNNSPLRHITFSILLTAVLCVSVAQAGSPARPKLIVVIALDQFRYDYLERCAPYLGEGGFRRLATQGASFTNASYKHARTITGPGHAVILSGSYGEVNGIVTNNWYDARRKKRVYCVEDDGVSIVGGKGRGASPKNFVGSTFGDELRIQSGFAAKVVSVSHKDRAAILLGGKYANIALWLRDSMFVTSSYYTASLPGWVNQFDGRGMVTRYFNRMWPLSPQLRAHPPALLDDAPWEDETIGRVFPHRISGKDTTRLTSSYFEAFMSSPFAGDVLAALAREAVLAEKLGKRGSTDLLCISFSQTDYVGHAFGPNSVEITDMVARTDELLAAFFKFLDHEIGAGKYLVALTSDHGVAPIPEYLNATGRIAGAARFSTKQLRAYAESTWVSRFGPPPAKGHWIEECMAGSLFLDDSLVLAHHLGLEESARMLAADVQGYPGIAAAVCTADLMRTGGATPMEQRIRRSCFPGRVGDVVYVLRPFMVEEEGNTGASHGQPYEYDSHVPLLIMGPGIKPGLYAGEASPADLAPTLSVLTGVELPAGREGRVLVEALGIK